ncbi:MAG: hypothetical protein H7196_01400 [candidate division SR1 bacterium]|nr:hypothetical protein [candidate division SR1 bacterium]
MTKSIRPNRKQLIQMFPELKNLEIPQDGLESHTHFRRLMDEFFAKAKAKKHNESRS